MMLHLHHLHYEVGYGGIILNQHFCSVAHVLSTLLDKVTWIPDVNRTWCLEDLKTIGYHVCRKQNSGLWTKDDKLKFAPLISALTAAFSSVTPSEIDACSSLEAHVLTMAGRWLLFLSLPLLQLQQPSPVLVLQSWLSHTLKMVFIQALLLPFCDLP